MLEAFDQGYLGDHEAHQEHVERHHFLGPLERVVMVENQFLHALYQGEGEEARQQRRGDPTGDDGTHLPPMHRVHAHANRGEADDGADDGVGGRYRPACPGGHHQPDTGGQ